MLKNKKILIFGLGILGGGLSSVEYCLKNNAFLRITDLKNKNQLKNELKKISKLIKKYNYQKKIKYILGKHRKEDFDWAEIIIVNPAISYKNPFVKYAQQKNKLVVNDCYLFFKYYQGEIIALTGTRGKTTTSFWIYQLFKNFISPKTILAGNQPEKALLKNINKKSIAVLELSSFQLEFYQKNLKAPKIAIITNIYEDHLNRYQNMEEYVKIKSNIFLNQNFNDYLILNYDNKWTKFILSLKPKSQIYFVSLKKLPSKIKGIFLDKGQIILRTNKTIKIKSKILNYIGNHNIYNLMTAIITLYFFSHYKNFELDIKKLENYLKFLKIPQFRQEVIYQRKNLIVINDSASTAPQATIEAINRFSKKNNNLILIIGGTDKNLNFKELAKKIKNKINSDNLIIINGSASYKIIEELNKIKYNLNKDQVFENLKECFKKALTKIKNSKKNIILFSPGAASFEKFKNEFDRGKKFNKLVKKYLLK